MLIQCKIDEIMNIFISHAFIKLNGTKAIKNI